MAHKVNTKELNDPTPVIIGAGITEEWYFRHLGEILGKHIKFHKNLFGRKDVFHLEKKNKIGFKSKLYGHLCF